MTQTDCPSPQPSCPCPFCTELDALTQHIAARINAGADPEVVAYVITTAVMPYTDKADQNRPVIH